MSSAMRPPTRPPMGGGGAPPMGGAPLPGGGMGPGPSAAQAGIEKNRSILNPTDANTMGARGQMDPNMSVRDWLGQFGVDVEGPVSQIAEMAKKQKANANPLTKMQNISQAGGGGAPAGPPRQPMGGAPPQQGMQDLMGGIRR